MKGITINQQFEDEQGNVYPSIYIGIKVLGIDTSADESADVIQWISAPYISKQKAKEGKKPIRIKEINPDKPMAAKNLPSRDHVRENALSTEFNYIIEMNGSKISLSEASMNDMISKSVIPCFKKIIPDLPEELIVIE